MKVKTLQINKLRNILEAKFDFDPTINKISGNNGAGKSTIIDAIFMCMVGKTYTGRGVNIEKLITQGEDKTEIELELEGSNKKLKISKKITESGNTSLEIRSSEGDKLLQKDLNDMLSEFTIDPLEFTKKSNKEKYDIVKKISGVDTDRIENEIAHQVELTKEKRAIATEDKKTLESIKRSEPKKVERVDVSTLGEELSKRQDHNQKIRTLEEKIESGKEYITELQKKIEQAEEKVYGLQDEIKGMEIKPIDELKEKIQNANETNQEAEKRERYKQYNKKSIDSAMELGKHKAKLEELRQKKKDMIAQAEMPIPNMEFNENDGVIINDIPFQQYSTAQQIIMACKIATSTNPTLKVIYIKDGSLLDEKSMKEIENFAEEKDYQIFIERVGEEFDSILMREGQKIEQE